MRIHAALALACARAGSAAHAADAAMSNGQAKTPPMGWSSWNQFGDRIDEKIVHDTIDAMAANGLKDAGFEIGRAHV